MNSGAKGSAWRGPALVAATYVYFLLFAEFAFLELARPVAGDGARLRLVMGALGAAGVAGSLLGARFFKREAWGRRLGGWLIGCAVAAGVAPFAPRFGVAALAAVAAGVGLSLGGATVALAAGLRAITGLGRLGLAAGLGTGAAYAFCNLPGVFLASPVAQTIWAVAAVLAGAILAWPLDASETEARAGERSDLEPGMGGWTVAFLALVWMDSAAFYIIQHTEALKAETWSGAWTLGGNALTHLVAAVLAGWLLDRGRAVWVVCAATGLLAAACHWIESAGAEVLYVAGVSLYSVALVYAPARSGRPWAAALVYAVAGWGGSALGIGMAQDLHTVPGWFAAAAAAAVAAGLLWRRCARKELSRVVAALAATLGAGAIFTAQPARAEDEAVVIGRGREVYISEGCIHCHSQYVRPGTEDVVRWGPARSLEELLRERPPLFGNRRQGPDLLNVGNRRSAEWNRLHLISPREVSPGSSMPSYERLFAPGERRGEDLVAYLASLGADTRERRLELAAAWRPDAAAKVDARAGAAWFLRACAQCHGDTGRGDGPLAGRLPARPADLTRSAMTDEVALARIIKFGRPGTAMAGHESLDDASVVSLSRHVRTLQGSEQTTR